MLALLVIAAFVLVAINASAGSGPKQQTVVVATRDLTPRIAIDQAAVTTKSIDVGGIPAALLFTKLSDVIGTIPLVTIVSGEPITSNLVAKSGETLGSQSAFLPIPSGYVALTVPTSEQQGVAGYIQPDDYISMIATVDANGKVATGTIFTNLHVIRVGQPAANTGPQTAAPTASSLTVVVTQCQAEFITWFLTFASLKYSLESFHDYLTTPSPSKDPACPGVDAAKGVNLKLVQSTYPSLF